MKLAHWPDFVPPVCLHCLQRQLAILAPKKSPKKGFPIGESYMKHKSAQICIHRDRIADSVQTLCYDFDPSPLDTTAAHGAHVLV